MVSSIKEMGRDVRWVPPNTLHEITIRCFQQRFLLKPTRRVKELVLGVLGRAQRRTGMLLHEFVFTSNHAHLYVTPRDAQQLADFVGYLETNVSKEVGTRLHRWPGKMFDRRYTNIRIWESEEDQVGRIRYCVAHGCKENLVTSPRRWPGARGLTAILNGTMKLHGIWIDRTRLGETLRRVRRRRRAKRPRRSSARKRVRSRDYTEVEFVELTPFPCWAHLEPEEYRSRFLEIVRELEEDALRRRREGTPFLGLRGVLAQHPHAAPGSPNRSPRPRYHARSREARSLLREAETRFIEAFRTAADRLRRGETGVRFPEGSFPPSGPFERYRADLPPPTPGGIQVIPRIRAEADRRDGRT